MPEIRYTLRDKTVRLLGRSVRLHLSREHHDWKLCDEKNRNWCQTSPHSFMRTPSLHHHNTQTRVLIIPMLIFTSFHINVTLSFPYLTASPDVTDSPRLYLPPGHYTSYHHTRSGLAEHGHKVVINHFVSV